MPHEERMEHFRQMLRLRGVTYYRALSDAALEQMIHRILAVQSTAQSIISERNST